MGNITIYQQRGGRGRKHPSETHGLYCLVDVGLIDRRTRIGRTVKALKHEFRRYVGESDILTEALAQRIIYKIIKLSMYEATQLREDGVGEADPYLPMANSLRLDLEALERLAGKSHGRTLDLDQWLKKVDND